MSQRWKRSTSRLFTILSLLMNPLSVLRADDTPAGTLPDLVVEGRSEDLVGKASSAAQGDVGQQQLVNRPIQRTGEVLETVPGLVVTQHSGTGKANQYFLRGFNLDHGTDFAVSVDGVPMNLPTHAHGQGYLDLNFLLPELIDHIEYKKGPYYAEVGDFSSAGAADIHYVNKLERGFVKLGIGEDHFVRGFAADSFKIGNGNLLYGFDSQYDDGPWDRPERFKKFSGLMKYTIGDAARGGSLALNGYSADWHSNDQIPQRAVDQGLISRFGTLSPSDGGKSGRSGVTANYWDKNDHGRTEATAYVHSYWLNIWSDFEFFLNNPVNGDQFEQKDRRVVSGGSVAHTWTTSLVGEGMDNTVGIQVRNDQIPTLQLRKTENRNDLGTVRQDKVRETSGAIYFRNEVRWVEKFKSILGLREDEYNFSVHSNDSRNSGRASDNILSPKLTLVFGPWAMTEYYINGGYGFHSNDARGTTITVDPSTGAPLDKVSPLVRSKGAEAGIRTNIIPNLRSTLAFWALKLDSELLFLGDAGATAASRPSLRSGVEWTNFYKPLPWLELDGDVALSHAQFTDNDPSGKEIPGSVGRVIAAGATVDFPNGYFGSLRVRYFGDLPLIEDNSVRGKETTVFNAQAGVRATQRITVSLDVLNVFNNRGNDISYFYTSRLQGEPAGGVDDIHFHPIEPREVRVYTTVKF